MAGCGSSKAERAKPDASRNRLYVSAETRRVISPELLAFLAISAANLYGFAMSELQPMPTWVECLGRVLRDERERQGLSLAAFAPGAGFSPQYLGRVERGRAGGLSLDTVDTLCAVYGVDEIDALRRAKAMRCGDRWALLPEPEDK